MACKLLLVFGFMTPIHICCRFRWVDCQLGYLRGCLPGRIRHALEELPRTLDETYERALKDLNEANWEVAHRLFQFVTVASRPLSVDELAQFLGFDFTTGSIPKFRQNWLLEDPIDAVLSTTSSLLAIVDVGDSQVIQFSHFSVKEFLTSSRLAKASDTVVRRYHISMPGAHTLAAQACLGILLHLDKKMTAVDLENFPLAEYAAEYWVDHARFEDVLRGVEDGTKQLFDPTKPHFAVWVWIHDLEDRYWRREKRGKRPSEPRGTPLHYAALCGLDVIVNFLMVEHAQDVDSPGFDRRSTALHLASARGHVEVARALLDNGADGAAVNKNNATPLHLASFGGHARVVRVLLERGVDETTEDDFPPSHLALIGGHLEVTRTFLEFGVGEVAAEVKNWPPLHRALFEGNIAVARTLLDHGADLGERADDGRTTLDAALLGAHPEAIRFLLERGVDIAVEDDDGSVSLPIVSWLGSVEIARIILEHGVDATCRGKDGMTSLHLASASGHVEIARLLLEYGASLPAQDDKGETALHFASKYGYVGVVHILLKHGADTTAREEDGWTPLHFAARSGHVEVARLLLDHGADTTAKNNDEDTPLNIAEANEHVELTRLLERGADATAQAGHGRVPIHITVDKGYVESSHLLSDGGTDVTAQSDERWTPVQVGTAEGNAELPCQLPEHRADGATPAEHDSVRTSIQVVAAEGPVEPLGLLPSPGIDATDQADDGQTPIQVSMSEGYVETGSQLPETRAVMTAQASNELTPSNVTAAEGHVEYAPSLPQPGPDATTHTDAGQTLLKMGPQLEREDVAAVLPGHGEGTVVHDDQQWCRCIIQ